MTKTEYWNHLLEKQKEAEKTYGEALGQDWEEQAYAREELDALDEEMDVFVYLHHYTEEQKEHHRHTVSETQYQQWMNIVNRYPDLIELK